MTKTYLRYAAAFGMTALSASGTAWAAAPIAEKSIEVATGTVVIPRSNFVEPEYRGLRGHTNLRLFFPQHVHERAIAPSGKYENPASLACVYGLVAQTQGCNPTKVTKVLNTGSKMIAIVDAFDYPTATNDLTTYSKQYKLPAITADNFQVVYADGTKPKQDSSGGWELEEALDIEMAHALAPNATVVLVEAKSNSTKDLFAAEKVASKMVAAAGGGEVSNSWSGGETAGEKKFEKTFNGKNVVFLASAGDSSGIGVPAALNDVIAVGGTSINRDNNFNYVNQSAWDDTGGGSSADILRPAFQAPVASIVGTYRGTPDISLVADPSTGVWVYDTTAYEGKVYDWLVLGGTSVSSPALAAIINSAGSFASSTPAELTNVYNGFTNPANWTDITAGSCGNNGGASAVAGWDFCTGVGVPNGFGGL